MGLDGTCGVPPAAYLPPAETSQANHCITSRPATALEAELRTKRRPQIVVRTAVEKDVIPNFNAQSNRARVCFPAAARIESEMRCAGRQANAVCEARRRSRIAHAEIIESDLAVTNTRNGPEPVWNFGPKKPWRVRRRDVTLVVVRPSLNVLV